MNDFSCWRQPVSLTMCSEKSLYAVSFNYNRLPVYYCPDCGGELTYESNTKLYVCKNCGRVYEFEELKASRERFLKSVMESDEERKRKQRKEVVKWWLGKKSEGE
jgi:rubredoxin